MPEAVSPHWSPTPGRKAFQRAPETARGASEQRSHAMISDAQSQLNLTEGRSSLESFENALFYMMTEPVSIKRN